MSPSTKQRLKEYEEAGSKTKIALDYCAWKRIVPREEDQKDLPRGWTAMSSKAVRDKILEEGVIEKLGNGTPIFAWQRAGADSDVDYAIDLLEDRRDTLVEAGLKHEAAWED
jgi:hypothetical protein